jgi:hypothetical protein
LTKVEFCDGSISVEAEDESDLPEILRDGSLSATADEDPPDSFVEWDEVQADFLVKRLRFWQPLLTGDLESAIDSDLEIYWRQARDSAEVMREIAWDLAELLTTKVAELDKAGD